MNPTHHDLDIDSATDAGAWADALREGAVSGTLAGVLSGLALAAAGRWQDGSAAAPINAVSHWLWDEPALHEDRATVRHTLVGFAIHHATAVMWSTLHARLWQGRPKTVARVLPAAAATAAVAAFVDFKLTPERLTPGFQHRLSTGALVGVYACFAVGLTAGSLLMGQRGAQQRLDADARDALAPLGPEV